MAQESKSKVAIIGGGPAGCTCAYFLQNKCEVTIFDKKSPLSTLLPTGGGRCNLANAEYDFKELAKNYPRGEKFLYSVFSKFSTQDTIDFFEKIGVKTYVQEDLRIFPKSNSSKDVREKFLKALSKVKFVKEEVININKITSPQPSPKLGEGAVVGNSCMNAGEILFENEDNSPLLQHFSVGEGAFVGDSHTNAGEVTYHVVTNKNIYRSDYIVIATGGHSSYELIKLLGHKIIEPKPSLTGLKTKENFSQLSGVCINDILFTHKGVSGPKIYEVSSIKARDNFPYKLNFDFAGEIDLQSALNTNPHKTIKNLLSDYVPKSFGEFVLNSLNIDAEQKCHTIDGKTRDKILDKLKNFEITAEGTVPDGEIVTSGGVDLKEINPKTLESKLCPNIYFCGEVLDIDGFCGGFNLQNCWSTGFVVAKSIIMH